MSRRPNPFLERTSERTTSDQEFVRLFSPKVLELISEELFRDNVHIIHSSPGGGKTTLLRSLTPAALHAFWHARKAADMGEACQHLVTMGVLGKQGPSILGVMLSCASGYADLPADTSAMKAGLFRALLDCRVVLRTLRSLAAFLGPDETGNLKAVSIEYPGDSEARYIPTLANAHDLLQWAEQREQDIYSKLDALSPEHAGTLPNQVRFESVQWLQGIRFVRDGQGVAERRLLMIDDAHKLRKKQRDMLIEEITDSRANLPIWIAQRSIAIGPKLLTQGAREGRDIHEHSLDDLWENRRVFVSFAEGILSRRLAHQDLIPRASFGQYLRSQITAEEAAPSLTAAVSAFKRDTDEHRSNHQYVEWFKQAEALLVQPTVEGLVDLRAIQILIARNEGKRQLAFDLVPLSSEDLDDRDSDQVHGAAEIFLHEELNIPYYCGFERLCVMATNNVEELLRLSGALYERLAAKAILRRNPELSAAEQEKVIKRSAKDKRDFIPKSHTEGTRAQRLLDGIGAFCRQRTFQPNAPIAPGVTGVRLSQSLISQLTSPTGPRSDDHKLLYNVLVECVAEKLLILRNSLPTTSRDGGSVFYLNRTLCAYHSLPLQMGGWQEVRIDDMLEWMERGPSRSSQRALGMR